MADQWADQMADEIADQWADQMADEIADQWADEIADQWADKIADEWADQMADEWADKIADEWADQIADQMADNPQVDNELLSQQNEETLEEMLSRHRKETSDLQNKAISMKKAAAIGSKAEQRAKKKQVDEEIHKLSTSLSEKQNDQLTSFGYTTSTDEQKGNMDILVKAIAGAPVSNQPEQSKPSKSVKRLRKRAQQEAAREQRIQGEQSQVLSDRLVEDEKLGKKPFAPWVHD